MAPDDVPSPTVQPRPADRVRRYLDHQLAGLSADDQAKLPTAGQLAAELGVSPRTVLTVYREYASRKLTRTRAGGGTLLTPGRQDAIKPHLPLRLGLNALPEPGDSRRSWSGLVCAGVVEGAASFPRPCAVIPLMAPPPELPGIPRNPRNPADLALTDMLIAKMDEVDGLVAFPSYLNNTKLLDAYAQAGKPIVHLNPPSMTATTGFASPDFYGASLRIGQAMMLTGRRSIAVMVADKPPQSGTITGVSSQMRINGVAAGIGASLGRGVNLHVLVADNGSEDAGGQAIDAWLDQGGPLDAVYCAGDMLALGILRALARRGLRVPEEVSVIGGTGADLSQAACPMLTRIAQPLRETGRALATMLCQRILHPDTPQPGIYLPTPIIGGATTRPAENALLGIGQPQPSSTGGIVPPAGFNP